MINGGIKFFNKNKININSAMVASSGDSSTLYIGDENYHTNWRSSGSSDLSTETITITFSSATTIDRLHLIGHNWKSYTIKYNSTSDFSNVNSLDASGLSLISENSYVREESYYEFDSVNVTTIDITATLTQAVDQEKYLRKLKLTTELGTFQGYPKVDSLKVNKGLIVDDMLSRRAIVEKQFDVFAMGLNFENYPVSATYRVDLELVMTLFDLDSPFYIWLCGGRVGTDYFRHALRGFRLQDLILVDFVSNVSQAYKSNIYINPVNLSFELKETVIND